MTSAGQRNTIVRFEARGRRFYISRRLTNDEGITNPNDEVIKIPVIVTADRKKSVVTVQFLDKNHGLDNKNIQFLKSTTDYYQMMISKMSPMYHTLSEKINFPDEKGKTREILHFPFERFYGMDEIEYSDGILKINLIKDDEAILDTYRVIPKTDGKIHAKWCNHKSGFACCCSPRKKKD